MMMLKHKLPILALLSLFLLSAFVVAPKPNLEIQISFSGVSGSGSDKLVTGPKLNVEALETTNEYGGSGLMYFNEVHKAAVNAAQKRLEEVQKSSSSGSANPERDLNTHFRYYFFERMRELGYKEGSSTSFILRRGSLKDKKVLTALSQDPESWSRFWSGMSRYFRTHFPNVLSEEKAAEIWRTAGYTSRQAGAREIWIPKNYEN